MKWISVIIFTLFFSSYSSGNFISPEQILFNKVITTSKYNDGKNLSDDDYDKISEYISQGKTRWIALYPTLTQEPFLGVTSLQEGLDIAMAYALVNNPNEVLKFVNNKNIDYICGAPFIEATHDEINNYLKKTNESLSKLKSSGYWKEKCVLNLRKRLTNESSIK